jgi:hypothetical protein
MVINWAGWGVKKATGDGWGGRGKGADGGRRECSRMWLNGAAQVKREAERESSKSSGSRVGFEVGFRCSYKGRI